MSVAEAIAQMQLVGATGYLIEIHHHVRLSPPSFL